MASHGTSEESEKVIRVEIKALLFNIPVNLGKLFYLSESSFS